MDVREEGNGTGYWNYSSSYFLFLPFDNGTECGSKEVCSVSHCTSVLAWFAPFDRHVRGLLKVGRQRALQNVVLTAVRCTGTRSVKCIDPDLEVTLT